MALRGPRSPQQWGYPARGRQNHARHGCGWETHGDEVHFMGLPDLRALDDLVREVQDEEQRDVEVCEHAVSDMFRAER